jgi:hypothetical protein
VYFAEGLKVETLARLYFVKRIQHTTPLEKAYTAAQQT